GRGGGGRGVGGRGGGGGQECVDGGVGAVAAVLRITRGGCEARVVGGGHARRVVGGARHRQQRQRRGADQRRPGAREHAPARRAPRQRAGAPFHQAIHPAALVRHRRATSVRSSTPCRNSWIEATPRSCASKRLSRCSREFTSPFARTVPEPSTSAAKGSFPTCQRMPSSGDSR